MVRLRLSQAISFLPSMTRAAVRQAFGAPYCELEAGDLMRYSYAFSGMPQAVSILRLITPGRLRKQVILVWQFGDLSGDDLFREVN